MLTGVVNPSLLKKLKEDDGGIGTIEHLDLSNGNVGSSELSLLTKAMVKLNQSLIVALLLCSPWMSNQVAHNTIVGTQSPVASLNLSNCNICGANFDALSADIKGLNLLCKSFYSNRYIRVLNFSGNVLTNAGFKILSDLLENNSSLHELR